MPNLFKTPGVHAPVISSGNNNVLITDEATRDELVRLRREALEAMTLKLESSDPPNGGSQDSMLRAHMPSKFKTPGARGAPLVSGDGNKRARD